LIGANLRFKTQAGGCIDARTDRVMYNNPIIIRDANETVDCIANCLFTAFATDTKSL
jgi:hypothetical protein